MGTVVGVNDAAALAEIKRLARLPGRLRFTAHARIRMGERNVTVGDVRRALVTATEARCQPDRGTFRVSGGVDTDDQELAVAVSLEDDVVVVTVF